MFSKAQKDKYYVSLISRSLTLMFKVLYQGRITYEKEQNGACVTEKKSLRLNVGKTVKQCRGREYWKKGTAGKLVARSRQEKAHLKLNVCKLSMETYAFRNYI